MIPTGRIPNKKRATHKHSLSSCKNLCMCMAHCKAVQYRQTGRWNKLTCGTGNSVLNGTPSGPMFIVYALRERIKLSTQMCTTSDMSTITTAVYADTMYTTTNYVNTTTMSSIGYNPPVPKRNHVLHTLCIGWWVGYNLFIL